jgi:hypothetical protein
VKAERLEIRSSYAPTPPQQAFRASSATVRGYGGAMGGGKTRALCEECWDLCLEFPGLKAVLARASHTSITETTKHTMKTMVIPPEVMARTRAVDSAGKDFYELPNGSVIHFIGLDNPGRWFSSEIGFLGVDEAHECSEDDVALLGTRLRQRLPSGEQAPNSMVLCFNPENPGHWLHQWFILGSSTTRFGFYKPELWTKGAVASLGDCEFVIARATDNPFLTDGYIQRNLGGLPEPLRRRYLEGEWLYVSGSGFFDSEALLEYQKRVSNPKYTGVTRGDVSGKDPQDRCRVRPQATGPWQLWKAPVRQRWQEGRILPAHRYVVSVDTSSGGSVDYSGIQVIDVEAFEQVAEYQAKVDPDLLAVEAYRIGRVYNDALVAPEITGGWGFTIASELKRLRYPRLYTRRIRDRLSDKWTDVLGWDTTTKTRAVMLDTLERVVREREFELRSARTLAEMVTFVRGGEGENGRQRSSNRYGSPAARSGCNDDLVITLAMGVTIATQLPRQLRRQKEAEYRPAFAATGW